MPITITHNVGPSEPKGEFVEIAGINYKNPLTKKKTLMTFLSYSIILRGKKL